MMPWCEGFVFLGRGFFFGEGDVGAGQDEVVGYSASVLKYYTPRLFGVVE